LELKDNIALPNSTQATGNQNFQAQISRRNGDPAAYQPAPSTPAVVALMETSAIADRNAIVSIYILCRCLIEIIGQTTLEALTPDMADKLQDIVFSQISDCDPRALMSSPLKLSNWTVCAELLGVMGNINFMKVTDTFFFSLEQHQNKPNAEEEGKMEYVIRAFGYLQLKVKSQPRPDSCTRLTFLVIPGKSSIGISRIRSVISKLFCKVERPGNQARIL
jgi:hypothetical protein